MLSEVDKALIRMGAHIAALEQKLYAQAKELEEKGAQITGLKDALTEFNAAKGSDQVDPVGKNDASK